MTFRSKYIEFFIAICLLITKNAQGSHSTEAHRSLTSLASSASKSDQHVGEQVVNNSFREDETTDQYSQVNFATPATIKIAALPQNK